MTKPKPSEPMKEAVNLAFGWYHHEDLDVPDLSEKAVESLIDMVAQALSEARREEMERCIKIAEGLNNGWAGSAIRQAIEDLP